MENNTETYGFLQDDQFKERVTKLFNGFDVTDLKVSRQLGNGIIFIGGELKYASSMLNKLSDIGRQIAKEFNLRYVTVRVTRTDFLYQFVLIK